MLYSGTFLYFLIDILVFFWTYYADGVPKVKPPPGALKEFVLQDHKLANHWSRFKIQQYGSLTVMSQYGTYCVMPLHLLMVYEGLKYYGTLQYCIPWIGFNMPGYRGYHTTLRWVFKPSSDYDLFSRISTFISHG